jgi:superfamily II DNA or RNA helicase
MKIVFPRVLAVDEVRARNRIRQIAMGAVELEGTLSQFTRDRLTGVLFRSAADGSETLIVPSPKPVQTSIERILKGTLPGDAGTGDLTEATWLKHPAQAIGRVFDYERSLNEVRESWTGCFSYIQEATAEARKGLRTPQIGAIHAVHAHWTASSDPATVVMPTGTGKTEVMLSVLVSARCAKVLVIVPTDALRTQISEKFLTLGVLKEPGFPVLLERAKHPIVGVLQHIPRNVADVDEIFGRCHVIVTTSSIAGQCDETVQARMVQHCSHLFIDEAHHAEAPTWSAFKERFKERRILQFTATPFREDGRPLDGKIIYAYPLRKAQEEEYFKPIHFRQVVEFNQKRSDEAIARAAIEQLRADFDKGHILMARTDSVARANSVFKLYKQYSEFKPVQLHTGIKSTRERSDIRRQIITKEARIVVCVDMLGEGFDLPELKIAAFHDIRKTLAVTLQLAGRFTRSRPDLGHATFIANTADVQVRDELRKLYSRDPDWNLLLPDLSERMIGEQMSLQEFLRGFSAGTPEIALKSLRPAMSTVVYRTTCANWSPANFRDGILGVDSYEQIHENLNEEKHTLIVVMGTRSPLPWGDVGSLFNWTWELCVVVWSPEQNLLFINSSGNAGEYRSIAQAIGGEDAALISGQEVFRAFAGVNRLRFQNIGLTEQLGRNVRYTGRMGVDVEPALTDLLRGRGSKCVLSGTGFENGELVAVGASRKGRIWSHSRGRVDHLAAWCKALGTKLLDVGINPDEVVKGTLSVKTVTARPGTMPIGVDWPAEIYMEPESIWSVAVDGADWPLPEIDIELVAPASTGPLRLAIASETDKVELELEVYGTEDEPKYRFTTKAGRRVDIVHHGVHEEATSFFYRNPPIFWFSDGSSLEGNSYAELRNLLPQFDAAKIESLDWTGVNLQKESQGRERDNSSIQARLIAHLKLKDYMVVFDDDAKGEVADVVAVRTTANQTEPSGIEVELYHCKFSRAVTPGRRVDDLYEVCGQAQKSIAWACSPDKRTEIFTHLLRRESLRKEAQATTRFEVGSEEDVMTLRDMSRVLPVTLKIYIVQPGIPKGNASPEQLGLLSVTENYLWETYQLKLGVIGSE